MQQPTIKEPTNRQSAKPLRRALKPLAFAAGALALGFVASTPALADFAVVRFADGHCQIWWDSAANPWGVGWSKIALGLPDATAARIALDNARAQQVCY